MKRLIAIAACFLMAAGSANAALINFNSFAGGPSGITFDGDADGIDDVQFTSGDGSPFNPTGPGINQVYIVEPGLEGTSEAVPYDLRTDFLFGAVYVLQFGFAVNSAPLPGGSVTFRVFDVDDNELASIVVGAGGSPPSDHPEGQVTLPFAGVAAYATFDFTSEAPSGSGRYIIDNLMGLYGSTQRATPVARWIYLQGGTDFGYSLDEGDLLYFYSSTPVLDYDITAGQWAEEGVVGWIYVIDWPLYYVLDSGHLMYAVPPVSGLWVYHFSNGQWTVLPLIIP